MDVGVRRWCLPNSWKCGTRRGTPGLGSVPRLSWVVAKEERGRRSLPLRRPWGSFLFGLVFVEPAFEEGDGGGKVVVEGEQQVDVVEVFLAAEAVGQVVAWVDRGTHFAAARTEEAEVAFAHFGRRSLAAQAGDGHGHGQVVAQATEQIGRDHGVLPGK